MNSDIFKEKYLLLRFKLNPSDPDTYAKLYDFYVDKVYRFVFFKVNKKEEAQDITAEVFLKLWQYIQNKDNKIKNLKAILYQIAKNTIIDYYRKQKVANVEIEKVLDNLIDERANKEMKEVEFKFELKSLDNFLRQLKAEYQEVLILKYIEGYSNKEIAKIMNKSNNNIRVISHRALKLLQSIINEESNRKNKRDYD